ncbi:MAG: hypothetical protein LBI02_10850 [Opitutaceae bacterium]|jgi:hypothetical protein|nr:hypothetical protein [Opitutaceae bacterium]
MSLREALDKRHAQEREKLAREYGGTPTPANIAAAGTVGKKPRCLRLVAVDARAWELPWASFYGAAFTATNTATDTHGVGDAPDCIELSFARFEVVLRGKHLAGLMDKQHAMTLPEVRTVDKKFLGLSGNDGEPAIVSIEVRKSESS